MGCEVAGTGLRQVRIEPVSRIYLRGKAVLIKGEATHGGTGRLALRGTRSDLLGML